jgi:hypothetical protein
LEPREEKKMNSPIKMCCAMRQKFMVGIVAESTDIATPIDLADFVLDWGGEGRKMLIGIKYCPFCGKKIENDEVLRDPRQ